MKLRGLPLIGTRAGALGAAAAPSGAGPRTERARAILLTLAFATLGALLALVLASDPAASRRLVESLPLEALAGVELLPGISALQALAGSAGLGVTWLLGRRLRGALLARRANRMAGANPGARTALVAAWTNKGAPASGRAEPATAHELLPIRPPAASPMPNALSLHQMADPAAAGDFLNWGRQAARSGDQMVAYRLLTQAVRLDPGNETAWLWLAGTCDERDEAVHCLERVLAINPENRFALRGLSELLAKDRP